MAGHGWPPGVDDNLRALTIWEHVSNNDAGWPEFDGKYINYPQFKKE
jgi:hypothetical protein